MTGPAIVLVHGGWTRSWVWEPLIRQLVPDGIATLPVDLHRGSLAEDTAAVQAAVNTCDTPPIVCGWSYGGCVITGLDPRSVHHLVYVAAFIPDLGESPTALLRTAERTPGSRAVVAGPDGSLRIDPDQARDALCHDCNHETVEWVVRRLEPQAGSGFTDSPASVAWTSTPSTALTCTSDRFLSPSLQTRMACRASTTVQLDASHGVLWSRTGALANLLLHVVTTADRERDD